MTDSGLAGTQVSGFERGQRVRLPGGTGIDVVEAAIQQSSGRSMVLDNPTAKRLVSNRLLPQTTPRLK